MLSIIELMLTGNESILSCAIKLVAMTMIAMQSTVNLPINYSMSWICEPGCKKTSLTKSLTHTKILCNCNQRDSLQKWSKGQKRSTEKEGRAAKNRGDPQKQKGRMDKERGKKGRGGRREPREEALYRRVG